MFFHQGLSESDFFLPGEIVLLQFCLNGWKSDKTCGFSSKFGETSPTEIARWENGSVVEILSFSLITVKLVSRSLRPRSADRLGLSDLSSFNSPGCFGNHEMTFGP